MHITILYRSVLQNRLVRIISENTAHLYKCAALFTFLEDFLADLCFGYQLIFCVYDLSHGMVNIIKHVPTKKQEKWK